MFPPCLSKCAAVSIALSQVQLKRAALSKMKFTLDERQSRRRAPRPPPPLLRVGGYTSPRAPLLLPVSSFLPALTLPLSSLKTTPRAHYRKLCRALAMMMLYVIILFLQRDPTESFRVYESLRAIVPEGSSDAPTTLYSKEDVYTWLEGARLMSGGRTPLDACTEPASCAPIRPPMRPASTDPRGRSTGVVFPTWNNPICGDGVCSFPSEYKAFGARLTVASEVLAPAPIQPPRPFVSRFRT